VHVAVFSTQKGIFHPYYVSALAPAVAALAGIGAVLLARAAVRSWVGAGVLAATLAGTAWLAVSLLDRTADFAPWLRIAIPVAAGLAVVGVVAVRALGGGRRLMALTAIVGTFAMVGGPASYAVANVGHALNGNNVLAGPSSVGQGGMGGGPGGGFGGGQMPSGARPSGAPSGGPPSASGSGAGDATNSAASGSGSGAATNSASGGSSSASAGSSASGSGSGDATNSAASGSGSSASAGSATSGGSANAAPSRGAGGGPGGGGSVSTEVINYLVAHQGSAKYLVAASGSQTTAPIVLATGKAVVTIGGFSGSDPAPTVAQLAAMVKAGELKYVLIGGQGGGPGGGSSSSDISTWVKAHGKAVTAVSTTSGTLYEVSA
jgi:hypothetical protein